MKTQTQPKGTPLQARLSDDGAYLIMRIAAYHGIDKTAVVEMLLRKEGRELGFDRAKDEATNAPTATTAR